VTRAKDGRFTKGSRRPPNAGRRRGTPNRATSCLEGLHGRDGDRSEESGSLTDAVCERPELMFKAAEHAVGKPRQSLEVTIRGSWTWAPPARSDGPISVPDGVLVFPQGMHIHEGGRRAPLPPLPRELGTKVDETNECPRCTLHPEERTDNGVR
jgi:hypothetical protein